MKITTNTYKYLFFGIIAFYCLVLSQFGFENWDSGFIQGFSWRIINGEDVYQDFLYIRPPVSAYFHAMFMQVLPEEGQYFFMRIVGYLLFGLQVFFTVSGFDKLYNLKSINVDKWGVMILCFVISMHNFFPNPWFNNDGIFFASIAFYLMARFRNPNMIPLFFIALFCLLSAFTKQSFYFIPILFFAWVFIEYGIKRTFYLTLSLLILLGIFLAWITSITSLHRVLEQVSEHTRGSDLLRVGFETYIRCFHNKYILITVIVAPLLYSYFKNNKSFSVSLYLKYLSFTFFISTILAIPLIDFRLVTVIFFDAVLISFVYKVNFNWASLKHYFPVFVLLIIAWCVGLSLGYPYPILYSTGLILAYLYLMHDDLKVLNAKKYLKFIAVPIGIYVFLLNINSYREKDIWELNYSLETISPKLKYIKTNKETFEKMTELKMLVSKYGPNYITTPHIPLSHYLFDTRNPIPAEWLTSFEINYKTEAFLIETYKKPIYIFLEKSLLEGEALFLNPTEADKADFSLFSLTIYKDWKPIAETKYFYVYDSQRR